MSFLKKIFGDENEKFIKKIQPIVDEINKLEQEFQGFSAEQLRNKIKEFKEQLKQGGSLEEILPQVFAIVREAAKKTLNQRHFDVQLIGGIALHQGKVCEMKTGEGKTLSATLPISLNALEGKGVHVVTVNDYLAKRDTVWMGQLYNFLGLSVSCIVHDTAFLYDSQYHPNHPTKTETDKENQDNGLENNGDSEERDKKRDEVGGFKVIESYLKPISRKQAYEADITYGTNHEFGFDYLRDNMAYSKEQRVQRGLNYAIIDEVDSVLIDEARTPMIISAPDMESSKLYQGFSKIIPKLKPEEDYEIIEKEKVVTLTDQGIEKIEKILGIDNIYQDKGVKYLHHLEQALRAETLFQKDIDYVVRNGEIIIVDEFTGRLMPGRRWSGGLHQAMEAKENLDVRPESLTLASISLQNYFRMYKKLAGMTGTAASSGEEFDKVYKLDVVVVPTNKPTIRQDLPDLIYKTPKGKLEAIIETVKESYAKGQPVLIGTRSIEKNELLSQFLNREGIPHQILNAKHHQKEGEIIAQAGRFKAVTVATNMAGRGVDIVLGGNPPDEGEAEKVKQVGGLFVIGTERHQSRRIDNQLRGRSGRQGDPGKSNFFLSLNDDLLRIFNGDRIKSLMDKMHFPEDQPIKAKIVAQAVESAQAKIEGMNFDSRKHLLEYDDVMNIHRISFYKKRNELIDNSDSDLRKKILEIFDKQGKKDDFLEKEKQAGETFLMTLRFLCLNVFDSLWRQHLEEMEYLRDRVSLRAYGQMDPLVEYKNEGYKMFQQFLALLEKNIVQAILTTTIKPVTTSAQQSVVNSKSQAQSTQTEQVRVGGIEKTPELNQNNNFVVPGKKKPGRNDPCPCGSGKKYKHCCYPKFG